MDFRRAGWGGIFEGRGGGNARLPTHNRLAEAVVTLRAHLDRSGRCWRTRQRSICHIIGFANRRNDKAPHNCEALCGDGRGCVDIGRLIRISGYSVDRSLLGGYYNYRMGPGREGM